MNEYDNTFCSGDRLPLKINCQNQPHTMMTIRSAQATGSRFTQLLHGGDYNPDQWLNRPDIIREDLRMMPLANCNVMSVGIFAWTALEPEEGVFTFDWLDRIIDDLAAHDIRVVLATPSGARPAWMAAKYPEVLRVGPNRVRNLYGVRHNHCYTSPVYRDKVRLINARLAERYGKHPALLLWHVSNEYEGECHCPLCQEAFRLWLRRRYADDLQRVNEAWNTSFWSHTYTTWEQIESPAPHGETRVHGHNLDWKR
ncbi:MAG: beta-galactosidase, partial [Verrucomicrobiales bacterium]